MPIDLIQVYCNLPLLALVAARVGGMVMFQPVLGHAAIPQQVRALLSFALALLVLPFVRAPQAPPDSSAGWAAALAVEAGLGFLSGLLLMIVFVGMQMGTLLIAQESGLAYGQVVDPTTEVEQSVLSVFYSELCAVVYLAVGGHRQILLACIAGFERLPVGSVQGFDGAVDALVGALAAGEEIAVRVAAPTVLTLFLVNVALGLISRTMPMLNATAVGFTLKSLVSFGVMAASLPTAIAVFTEGVERAAGWIDAIWSPTG